MRSATILTVLECFVNVIAIPLTTRQLSPQSAQRIQWGDCSGVNSTTLQCGNLTVPISYDDPLIGNLNLVLFRLPAGGHSSLGSLIYNPGGPGYSVEELMVAADGGAPLFSEELLKSYDLIGYDPRGVGRSTPVMCDPDLGNARVYMFPRNETEYQTLMAHNMAFGASCANMTGTLFYHLDTVHVAKDLEMIRQALDSAKLNFLGQSYGSQVGYQYAERYPRNVGRMLLDGILDHTSSETNTVNVKAQTYEMVLKDFFAWCNATSDCALQGGDIEGIWNALTDQHNISVVPAPGCIDTGACGENVSKEEVRLNAQGFLLFQNETAEALAEAYAGNATLLSYPLADGPSFELFSFVAIGCQDYVANTASFAQLDSKMRMLQTFNPLTQGSTQSYWWQISCIGWPAPITNPQAPIDQTAIAMAPPIVLLQSTQDPSCSLVWATNVQAQMPGSVTVTRVGAGHTSYHLPGEARRVADAFLINGTLPKQDTAVYS